MNKTSLLVEKKKQCHFCLNGIREIDYKNIDLIRRFISPYTAKILSKKKTGVCEKHQRNLAQAIKRARFIALISFTKK